MFYQSHGPAMALSSDDLNLRVPFVSCWNLNWYRFKESFFFFFNYGLISPTVDLCLFLLDLLWFLGSPIYHDLYSGLLPSVSQPPGATYICCCNSYPVSTTPQLGPRHPLLNIPLFGSTPSVILATSSWKLHQELLESWLNFPWTLHVVDIPLLTILACWPHPSLGEAGLPEPIHLSSSIGPMLLTWNTSLPIILVFSFFSSS